MVLPALKTTVLSAVHQVTLKFRVLHQFMAGHGKAVCWEYKRKQHTVFLLWFEMFWPLKMQNRAFICHGDPRKGMYSVSSSLGMGFKNNNNNSECKEDNYMTLLNLPPATSASRDNHQEQLDFKSSNICKVTVSLPWIYCYSGHSRRLPGGFPMLKGWSLKETLYFPGSPGTSLTEQH